MVMGPHDTQAKQGVTHYERCPEGPPRGTCSSNTYGNVRATLIARDRRGPRRSARKIADALWSGRNSLQSQGGRLTDRLPMNASAIFRAPHEEPQLPGLAVCSGAVA